jgi:hypothetical protein
LAWAYAKLGWRMSAAALLPAAQATAPAQGPRENFVFPVTIALSQISIDAEGATVPLTLARRRRSKSGPTPAA